MNTKMAQGTPIKEHCLKMIPYLNTLEVLGADINGESSGYDNPISARVIQRIQT